MRIGSMALALMLLLAAPLMAACAGSRTRTFTRKGISSVAKDVAKEAVQHAQEAAGELGGSASENGDTSHDAPKPTSAAHGASAPSTASADVAENEPESTESAEIDEVAGYDDNSPAAELSANTPLDLSPYRGKAVLLNFFTSWCYYCMQEMPDIKDIFDDYSEDDLQIILIHVWDGETGSATAGVVREHDLHDLTIFEDEDGEVASFVGIPGYPTSVLLDADGEIVLAAPYMLTYDDIADELDALGVAKK